MAAPASIFQKLQQLNEIAAQRGQSLSDLALNWVLRDERVTTVVMGVSRIEQLEQNILAVREAKPFDEAELSRIESALAP